jgi:hypothetical protein
MSTPRIGKGCRVFCVLCGRTSGEHDGDSGSAKHLRRCPKPDGTMNYAPGQYYAPPGKTAKYLEEIRIDLSLQ